MAAGGMRHAGVGVETAPISVPDSDIVTDPDSVTVV